MAGQDLFLTATPEEAGMDSGRLAAITPAMQRYIDEGMVPHIITMIARKGKIVRFEAQGYLDLEKKTPAGKDSIVRLYSNSKAIAGAAVMLLCEEGLLNLDDPVSKYIPAFKGQRMLGPLSPHPEPPGGIRNVPPLLPVTREITIRDCLSNTTGLATPAMTPVTVASLFAKEVEESGWDLAAMLDVPPEKGYKKRVEALAKLPLSFEPGTDFLYHAGYLIIGVVLEKITGKNLDEFYHERIFEPLGMNDTSFYLDPANLDRFSVCYCPSDEDGSWHLAVYDDAETSEKVTGPPRYFGAGGDMGGLLSTAADYMKFALMLYNGGELDGVKVLSRKSVEIMTASHTGDIRTPMLKPGFGFGLGVSSYTGNSPVPQLKSPGTFGWGGAAGTDFFVDPKEELVALCFSQVFNRATMPGNDYQETFEKLVYQALL